MAKQPLNSGKPWTAQQAQDLKHLAAQNTPTRIIGLKLGRTPTAIQSKASGIGLSLKPTNQSPYGTKRK
jgi:hypothetical protein